jgi:hypothetical protein
VVPDNPDKGIANVRNNRPFHLLPPAKQRVGEKLENVNKHHGVVVNYNTKSIASLFFGFLQPTAFHWAIYIKNS